ncbi:MAG: Ig-like domain-containing protein [Xanthomonadales bacterium]|nr:Ig-like domain-containing protein [Xanthomonadales bacterium]
MYKSFFNKKPQLLACAALLAISSMATAQTELSITRHGPNPSQAGVGFVVSAALNSTSPLPFTGSITVAGGGNSCVITLPSTRCLLEPSSSSDNYSIEAHYSGDENHSAADAEGIPHQVVATSSPRRVSVGDGGTLAGAAIRGIDAVGSFDTAMTPDGRFVAYTADTVSTDDITETSDIAVFDRANNTTTIVTVDGNGVQFQGNSSLHGISNDGQRLLFTANSDLRASDTNQLPDIYVFDRSQNQLIHVTANLGPTVSIGNLPFVKPQLSGNGEWVAFYASDFSTFNFNDFEDIYVVNVNTFETKIVPLPPLPSPELRPRVLEGLSISDDGQTVAISKTGEMPTDFDIVQAAQLFIYDTSSNITREIELPPPPQFNPGLIFSLSITGDGRYVFFNSFYDALVSNDTNFSADAFRLDLTDDSFEIVALNENGERLDTGSGSSVISNDGIFLSFSSDASNILPGTSNAGQVFENYRRNLVTGEVTLISRSINPAVATEFRGIPTAISNDGAINVFETRADILDTGNENLGSLKYIVDTAKNTTDVFPPIFEGEQADQNITEFKLAQNGQAAMMASAASTLVEGQHLTSSGSALYFDNDLGNANNPWALVIDPDTGTQNSGRSLKDFDTSEDARFVSFISSLRGLSGVPTNISGDNVFLRDRQAGTNTLVTRTTSNRSVRSSSSPSVSNDGRWVSFVSSDRSLVDGDGNRVNDVFLFDNQDQSLQRISLDSDGNEAAAASVNPLMDTTGNTVIFDTSNALVSSDTNAMDDVYAYGITGGALEVVSLSNNGLEANGVSQGRDLSQDGRFVLFYSEADNLVNGDNNGQGDFFIRDRQDGNTQLIQRIDAEILSDNTGACIAGNGDFVLFQAGNALYLNERQRNRTREVLADLGQLNADIRAVQEQCFSADAHSYGYLSANNDSSTGIDNNRADAFIAINPMVNASPLASNDSYTILEDESLVLSGADFDGILANDNDPDGDLISLINVERIKRVRGLRGELSVGSSGSVSFTPEADRFGQGRFNYRVSDGIASDRARVSIEVLSVNDQPSFTVPSEREVRLSNRNRYNVRRYARFDAGARNESSQRPQYFISNISQPEVFSQLPSVTAGGALRFSLIDDAPLSTITFDLQVQDNGGTDNGGIDTSETQQVRLEIMTDRLKLSTQSNFNAQ